MGKILVIGELSQGQPGRATWEAITGAQQLAGDLGKEIAVLVLGDGVDDAAKQIAAKEVTEVLTVQDAKLADYTPDGYSAAIQQVVEKEAPDLVLMSHTYQVRDYAPKLAAKLGRGFVSDCTRYRVEDGSPVFVRQVFQGKIDVDVRIQSEPPHLVSFQAGTFNPADVREGQSAAVIRSVDVDLSSVDVRTKVLEIFQGVKQEVDLSKAERIVTVGRGIKSPENLKLAEELAGLLNAEIGASRPVCDEGWLPIDRQIGSSGQTVAPRLYLALGVSGAIQHLVGMKNSQVIVAINKDSSAPIFDVADYGVVGDLFEVVPALIEKLKES
jgi:electron transfer flavoprotein alpha subunit